MDYAQDRPLIYLVKPAPPENGGKQAADEAARFLSFTPISRVISSLSPVAISTAQTIAVGVNVPYAERDAALATLKAALPAFAKLAIVLPHPIVLVTESAEGEPGDITILFLTRQGETELTRM